jgi:hypothetical protein
MSDSLLTTMAILLANYDVERDYLSNFEPFVIDRLKAWEKGEEVRSKKLSERLSESSHLPEIPINTVTDLRERALRDGYLTEDKSRKLYPNFDKLAAVPSLAAGETEFLAHFNKVADSIQAYAREVHQLEWTTGETEEALEKFVEEFSVELAMAKRTGGVKDRPGLRRPEALAVVHAFARQALTRDPSSLAYLEEIVRASMLANVLYFQDLGNWQPKLDHVVVYLDTTVAFRALGLTDPEVSEAAQQMLDLLHGFKVPVQIFDHTVVEMQGVLEGVQHSLRTIRTKGRPELDKIARQGQEVLVHALRQKWSAADIEDIIANLESRLAEQNLAVAVPPPRDQKLTLKEARLEEILTGFGFKENQRIKDIDSLSAIHSLRKGRPCNDLGEAKAIFVTSNEGLVRASNWWFGEQGKRSRVPQCISEISLTTQLWLRKPEERPEIARKFLIAESFAALNPAPDLWERYLDRIAMRQEHGDITDEQVKALVFSVTAKEGLIEVTHGDPDQVDDEAVMEVLARYEDRVRAPLLEEMEKAQRGIRSLRSENDGLRGAIGDRDQRIRRQEVSLKAQQEQLGAQQTTIKRLSDAELSRQARESAARKATSIAAAALVMAVAIVAWISDWEDDSMLRAGIGFAAVCLGTASLAWGFRRDLKWAVTAIIAVGAFTALFFGLVTIADHDEAAPSASQAVEDKPSRP